MNYGTLKNDYRVTLSVIETELFYRFPYARAEKSAGNDINHTLWMIDQIKHMVDQSEIDRHVGWILAKAHSLGILDQNNNENKEAKALIKIDMARVC